MTQIPKSDLPCLDKHGRGRPVKFHEPISSDSESECKSDISLSSSSEDTKTRVKSLSQKPLTIIQKHLSQLEKKPAKTKKVSFFDGTEPETECDYKPKKPKHSKPKHTSSNREIINAVILLLKNLEK